jgi:hypothetical protein
MSNPITIKGSKSVCCGAKVQWVPNLQTYRCEGCRGLKPDWEIRKESEK